VSDKTRVTVSLPRERREQLDREADRRGASRSSTVHQIVEEWDERGEEVEELRAEVEELRERRAELEAHLDEREEALADGGEVVERVDEVEAAVRDLRAEIRSNARNEAYRDTGITIGAVLIGLNLLGAAGPLPTVAVGTVVLALLITPLVRSLRDAGDGGSAVEEADPA